MMRYLYGLLILLVSLFILTGSAFAKEYENECSNSERVRLSNLAAPIGAEYALKKVKNEYVFYITVYNITSDDVMVRYSNNAEDHEFDYIYAKNTNNGTYVFETKNINEIVEYRFEVRSNVKCKDYIIRTFTLTKPKRNIITDDILCQYEAVKDYYYCKEWITRDFTYSKEQILKKIENEIERVKEKTTLKQDLENSNKKEGLSEQNKKIVIVIATIIITILLLIGVQMYRIKRYEI